MASFDYDLIVIGSGPAGQRAAIQAAKLGKKTALVERKAVLGGVCINTGTIPSKTLREAVLYLQQNVPYEVGKANYREIARGQIIGDDIGMLKLLFHRDTRDLLGVHIIGESASELVHIGQAVLTLGGKIDYFISNVFNYPTLAEGYKIAAFDGVNQLAN